MRRGTSSRRASPASGGGHGGPASALRPQNPPQNDSARVKSPPPGWLHLHRWQSRVTNKTRKTRCPAPCECGCWSAGHSGQSECCRQKGYCFDQYTGGETTWRGGRFTRPFECSPSCRQALLLSCPSRPERTSCVWYRRP